MEKPRRQIKTMEEYISTFPNEIQDILKKLREIIRSAAPGAQETISYQMPTFAMPQPKARNNLVHFAAFKNHIGFYPTPSGIEAFKTELSQYKFSKGSVQFPLSKSIPYDLVKKIVEFRVKETLSKKK